MCYLLTYLLVSSVRCCSVNITIAIVRPSVGLWQNGWTYLQTFFHLV